ncbi:hypothetical protein GWO60_01935 [Corynebacterium macginleyi]|nr:hypothetical protein [Corynebacterium macginleyi]MBK4143261.1 hypothetical protein [Corynebacterium macginleyi]MBK4153355.1 hypothetical protein [Corynebacterium macginleyi]MBK4157002.1 hypothetical protein [Corynebacterium macginleyi]MBK4161293.1 hypothetical protein [Corynebacterium macginleyi]MBK4173371.1 hypothetical protein [Corynebacterium macginleyi]
MTPKRKEDKRRNAAVVTLARRRINVLYALMRHHEYYRDPAPSKGSHSSLTPHNKTSRLGKIPVGYQSRAKQHT